MKKLSKIILAIITLVSFIGITSCKKANNVTPTPLKMWKRAEKAYEYKNGVELTVMYVEATSEFKVNIVNNNGFVLTNSRVEIHTFDVNGTAIFEYGPTPDTDVSANGNLSIVIPGGTTIGNFTDFSMHVEYGSPAGTGG